MIKNFILIAYRNLIRNKLYSLINIIGLSVGIVFTILIALWVNNEWSFDKFIPKADRLYQVWVSSKFEEQTVNWRSVPLPIYDALKTDNSNIKHSAVTGWGGERLLSAGDMRIKRNGYYVSEEFLEMFEFPMVKGSNKNALNDPMSIVLSESLAKVLFGEKDPIGQLVKVENEGTLKVTGIVADIPEHSSFQFDYLLTWKYYESTSDWVIQSRTNWGNYSFQVFAELNDPSDQAVVETSIANMLTENGQVDVERSLFLYPMLRWRLYSIFDEDGNEAGGRIYYVKLFTIIAIVILAIACINFMNMVTAKSEKRAREVGIRKSFGSSKTELISQFIAEAILMTCISYILAILITIIVLPSFNEMVFRNLSIDFSSPFFWITSLGFILTVGVFAGSYPAFYLSSFKPSQTLKGTTSEGKSSSILRKVLVILQFGFSIILLLSTIVFFQQIDLIKKRDIGYNQENLISIELTNDLRSNYKVLKQELLQSGYVASVTKSSSSINSIVSQNFLGWPGKPESEKVLFATVAADYDYAKTMGIEVLMGRDFSKELASDSNAIIINKAALEMMGLEDPIGTKLDLWNEKRTLIGVIDNVLMGSPYEPVGPMFAILADWGGYISLRTKGEADMKSVLDEIAPLFEKHNPAYPFEYSFADAEYKRKFIGITVVKNLANLFAMLAIIISGLGLLGLASFMAERRVKEIGIRKVLGATVLNITQLMSKDFAKLILISFVLSAPVGWYLLNQYLDQFKIRVNIEWWIFPTVGLAVFVFAVVIVSFQSRKAATANPVKSLRNQ